MSSKHALGFMAITAALVAFLAPPMANGKAREIGGIGDWEPIPDPDPELVFGDKCGPWRYVNNAEIFDLMPVYPCISGNCPTAVLTLIHTPPQCEWDWGWRRTCANVPTPVLESKKNQWHYQRDMTIPGCACVLVEIDPATAATTVVAHC